MGEVETDSLGRPGTPSPWVCTQEKAQPHPGHCGRLLPETSKLEVTEGCGLLLGSHSTALSGFILSSLAPGDRSHGSSPFCHNCLLFWEGHRNRWLPGGLLTLAPNVVWACGLYTGRRFVQIRFSEWDLLQRRLYFLKTTHPFPPARPRHLRSPPPTGPARPLGDVGSAETHSHSEQR